MKKTIVSIVIIGAFAIYSFLYAHSGTPTVLPTTGSRSSANVTTSVTPTPTDTSTSGSTTTPTATSTTNSGYKDGSYTGSVADAQWGVVQVKAVIQGGKITQVEFLQYPNDRNRSININNYADPQLSSEAIQAQSANVDIVTGATDSSEAFIQSLTDALA